MKKKPTPFKSRVAPKPEARLRTLDEVKAELHELATRAGDQQFQIVCTQAILNATNQRMLECNQEYARILEATKTEETPPAPPAETAPVSEATH